VAISLGVQTWGTDVAALRRYWRRVDELGYARLTYGDGLGPWTHDGWTMLGAMALATSRARIGSAVTYCFDPSTHHPSWIAKRSVAVDHLSNGRFDLRLAVGAENEASAALWRSHGIDYPPAGERLARVEATVTAVRGLWRGESVSGDGPFGAMRDARVEPGPIQSPGPPVWLAAMGPRALELTARVADGWEASYLTPEALAERWERVRALLAQTGRAPESLRRSVEADVVIGRDPHELMARVEQFSTSRAIEARHPLLDTALIGEPAAIRDHVKRFADAGATDLMLGFADFPATDMLELFAEAAGIA
jgi:alkanesulfonate monooxygenase SsuD/methylene tetrahydromethanopterin reductase-like flavin-dependent oxidoreductase (luciferase family)